MTNKAEIDRFGNVRNIDVYRVAPWQVSCYTGGCTYETSHVTKREAEQDARRHWREDHR